MHLGLIFAMEEEAAFLPNLFKTSGVVVEHPVFSIREYNKNNVKFTAIISKIGKAFSAAATTVLIEKYKVDTIINVGSCGGLKCNVGDIIIANSALYHDVDVTAFGYPKGALPKEPLIFTANSQIFKVEQLVKTLNNNQQHIISGVVATGDQFINNLDTVNIISTLSDNIKALEMEGAAIAQICHHYNKDFILIKKVSDLADQTASHSFKTEIINFEDKIIKIIDHLIASF